jgi:signal peptidase I
MWRLASPCTIGAAFALGLCVLVPALLGFQRYVITSGSMSGTYDRGSLVFDRVVATSSLKAGDVITFRPPGQAGLVTHRVVSVRSVRGQRVLRTKGDANREPDLWGPFALHGAKQARVAFHIPYGGAHDDRPREREGLDRRARHDTPKDGANRQKAGLRRIASVNAPDASAVRPWGR